MIRSSVTTAVNALLTWSTASVVAGPRAAHLTFGTGVRVAGQLIDMGHGWVEIAVGSDAVSGWLDGCDQQLQR